MGYSESQCHSSQSLLSPVGSSFTWPQLYLLTPWAYLACHCSDLAPGLTVKIKLKVSSSPSHFVSLAHMLESVPIFFFPPVTVDQVSYLLRTCPSTCAYLLKKVGPLAINSYSFQNLLLNHYCQHTNMI